MTVKTNKLKKYPKLGKRFKELRKSLETINNIDTNVTQERLAELIGIGKPQISDLENGKRLPSMKELIAYSGHFNVPMEYLLGKSNSRYFENQIVSKELGLSDKAIARLKFMQAPGNKHMNYTDIINCIFDSGLDAKFWQGLYYYFFRDLKITNSDLIKTGGELADVSFSLGDKKDCLNYKLPINEADSINEMALHFTLSEIKNKLYKTGYQAKKLIEDEEADYTLLPPQK